MSVKRLPAPRRRCHSWAVPRYLVERYFDRISDDEMLALSVASDRIAAERFPEIVWEHSHVCVDDSGAITTFCVYEAPSEDVVRDHAAAFGGHSISRISEIADDVTPVVVRERAAAVAS
jgi:Nickel responsive protein SCO4226-like